MAKYKGRIKNVTTDEWVSDETDGIVTMVKKKKEACVFNEESDAVSTLEMLNDRYADCFTLIDNK